MASENTSAHFISASELALPLTAMLVLAGNGRTDRRDAPGRNAVAFDRAVHRGAGGVGV